jgi:acetyl esterase/lipase
MKQRRNRLFAILASVTLVIATVVVARYLHADVKVQGGIVYGKGGDTNLKLDLARPQHEDGPRPAVIFIHGGGWAAGHRWAHRRHIKSAAERGYVAVSISYRLMKFDHKKKETTTATPTFPAQVHDAKAAVRWLRANAAKFNVDPNRIGVVGFSAGGHLALMLGLTDHSANLEGQGGHSDQSSRVQAVVNFFGPTAMAECYSESRLRWLFRLFLDGKPDEVPNRYKASSPVTYATQDDPPVLTIQGDRDVIVPVSQAHLLDATMKEAGASHTLMILKGQPHGYRGKYQAKAFEATFAFLDEHLTGH